MIFPTISWLFGKMLNSFLLSLSFNKASIVIGIGFEGKDILLSKTSALGTLIFLRRGKIRKPNSLIGRKSGCKPSCLMIYLLTCSASFNDTFAANMTEG